MSGKKHQKRKRSASSVKAVDAQLMSPRRADAPQFHRMSADDFEEMCCALFDREPGLKNADLFARPRQLQYGIDIRAEYADGSGIGVVSCKCYKALKKGEIAGFSDDFLTHWESYWSDKAVKKFVLAVSVDVRSTERQTEILAEKTRFKKLGIDYEVWAPRQLQGRLRPHPAIVSQHLGEAFLSQVCGTTNSNVSLPAERASRIDQELLADIGHLRSALSGEIEKRLETILEDIRVGKTSGIDDELHKLRNDKDVWRSLNKQAMARVLRIQASRSLIKDDFVTAESLADEADKIFAQEEPRLRALLEYRRAGPKRALKVLGKPKSQDGRFLYAGLLLDSDQPKRVLQYLSAESATDDAEEYRLLAYAHLGLGDARTALEFAIKAEAAAPQRLAIRQISAIAHYAAALSPGAGRNWLLAPNPLPLDLVREDAASVQLLDQAFEKFVSLSEREDRANATNSEIWALACLCNNPDRFQEAEQYLDRLIKKKKISHGIIVWALARNLNFDMTLASVALQRMLENTQENEDAFALALLNIANERYDEARTALKPRGKLFKDPESKKERSSWLADITALKAKKEPSNPRGALWEKLDKLEAASKSTGSWGPVERYFIKEVKRPFGGAGALMAARMLLTAAKPQQVAKHAEPLVEHIATSEAARVAAIALRQVGSYGAVAKIIDESVALYRRGLIPYDLRRLKIAALQDGGAIADALREAIKLSADSSNVNDRLLTADLMVAAGNLEGAIALLRQLSGEGSLPKEYALQIASLIRDEDIDTARTIYRNAIAEALPDSLVTTAWSLAFELGLEDESQAVHDRAVALAEQGSPDGPRAADISELQQWFEERKKAVEEANNRWLRSHCTVHHLVTAANISLGQLLNYPTLEEEDPYQVILMRHGSRHLVPNQAIDKLKSKPLKFDISALITADQLGILDAVETLGHGIQVPRHCVPAFYESEDKCRHQQPARLKKIQLIKQLLQENKFQQISAEALTRPTSSTPSLTKLPNWVICHEGKITNELLANSQAPRITPYAVLQAVHREGAITLESFRRLSAKLGNVKTGNQPLPSAGNTLFFEENTIETLAAIGVVDPVLSVFDVQVESAYIDSITREIEEAAQLDRIGTRLARLRKRVAKNLGDGTYTIIPVSPNAPEPVAGTSAATLCLNELLPSMQAAEPVVVDDRLCSTFSPNVLGTFDVLVALYKFKKIDGERYYEALIRLRKAYALFLPITPQEILYHLGNASLEEGSVVESPALEVIRRYVSQALILEKYLKVGPDTSGFPLNLPDEAPILVLLQRLAENCLAATWAAPHLPVETRRAWSSWIWHALRVECFMRVPAGTTAGEFSRSISSFVLAGLISLTFQIVGGAKEIEERRSNYLAWLNIEILIPRLTEDKELATAVCRHLGELILSLVEQPDRASGIERFILQLIKAYPQAIREGVLANQKLRVALHVDVKKTVSFSGLSVRDNVFVEGAAKAFREGSASVQTIDGQVLAFRPSDQDIPMLEITGAATGSMTDDLLTVLMFDGEQLRERLWAQKNWFDFVPKEAELRIQKVIDAPNLLERLELAEKARDASAVVFYGKLERKISSLAELPIEAFLPPDHDKIISHLRLAEEAVAFPARTSAAAEILRSEFEIAEAFARLAALPTPLPKYLFDQIRAVPQSERDALLTALSARATGLTARFHLIAILEMLSDARLPTEIDNLLNGWEQKADLFLALLRWTEAVYVTKAGWIEAGVQDRLAAVWFHAGKLFSFVEKTSFDVDETISLFMQNKPLATFKRLLMREDIYDRDAARPTLATAHNLLFCGLGLMRRPTFTTEQREQIESYLTRSDDGQVYLNPLLQARALRSADQLRSMFLFWNAKVLVGHRKPSRAERQAEVLSALEKIASEPNILFNWTYLRFLARAGLTPDEETRLIFAFSGLSHAHAAELASGESFALCRIQHEVMRNLLSSPARDAEFSKVQELAERSSALYKHVLRLSTLSPDNKAVNVALFVGELACQIAASDTVGDGLKRFTKYLVTLGHEWPVSRKIYLALLISMIAGCRPEEIWESWEEILVVRRLA